MKSHAWMGATSVCLFVALAMPVGMVAQDSAAQNSTRKHHHYNLIELGTFGGPTSNMAGPPSRVLNSPGTAIGWADSKTPDPFTPNCFDPTCSVQKSFIWQDERLVELPSLVSGASSAAFWENDHRWVVGVSETGSLDTDLETPQFAAVLWRDGYVRDLGTLGGNSGVANAVNNRGEVVGGASNGVADEHSMLNFGFGPFPSNTQSRAFAWVDGALFDLGTLGGSDSMAIFNNDRGQVVGISYPNDDPVPGFGGYPATATFLWQQGEMKNIGDLGGHATFPRSFNNRGEIVGTSNIAGDYDVHAFLWNEASIRDLGTLGGEDAFADSISENGLITGYSETVVGQFALGHPYLWKDGHMIDLGPPKAGFNCASGQSVNIHAQVVGDAGCNSDNLGYPFLWEKSNPIVDLNTLLVPGTAFTVQDAISINDKGEIACRGTLANGDMRACLLVPLDDDHDWIDEATAGVQSATNIVSAGPTTGVSVPNRPTKDALIRSPRNEMGRRYHPRTQYEAPFN